MTTSHHGDLDQHDKDGAVAVENKSIPEIPRPLTSTFTTNFDLRKGSAHNTSTTFGLSRERRASMEGMERPKFDRAQDMLTSDCTDDILVPGDEDDGQGIVDKSQLEVRSFIYYLGALDLAYGVAIGGTVATFIIALIGLFIAYRAMEAHNSQL